VVSGNRHGSAGDNKHAGVTSRLAAIHNAATLHVKSRKRRRAEVEANAIAIETETFVSSAAHDKIVKEAEEKTEKEKKQKLLSMQHHPTPHTSLFSASAIGKSSSSSVTTPAQGSLLALAQALVGGAVRPQAPIAAAHSNAGKQHQVVKEISVSASTLIDASKQSITSSSTISTVNSLPAQSSADNAKPPHGGERMRKLRRDVHGWRVAEPGNSLALHEAYSHWWTAVYAETVKVSVSSGSQPTSKVSGGGGGGGGGGAVSLADINAALKERKKEEEMKKKGLSLAANQKLKPVKPESKASVLPTSLASAALIRAVNLSLVKSVQMKGAWVEVTRCREQLPLPSLPPQTTSTLASAKESSSSSSIRVNDSEVQSLSLPHQSHHFSGFITWIGSEYLTICSPFPHSLRRVTLKKKGTMLCVRWPTFALKKGERFVTDPPGPIETVVECYATDLLPSD